MVGAGRGMITAFVDCARFRKLEAWTEYEGRRKKEDMDENISKPVRLLSSQRGVYFSISVE